MHGQQGVCLLKGWQCEARKSVIMTSHEMEAFSKQHDMPSLPEMIHGRAVVRFSRGDLSISFSALDALVQWRKLCFEKPGPRVHNSKAWSEERAATLADIPVKQYDWTFFSDYSGTISGGVLEPSDRGGIPYEKLKQKEDIVFFESLVLMEDELADNGTCQQSAKVRVMPSGFFCLHRMLLRVDEVVATIHDTRLYHEFGSDVVFHEFSVRSSSYEQLKASGKYPKDDPALLGDENYLYESLEKVSLVTSVIRVK